MLGSAHLPVALCTEIGFLCQIGWMLFPKALDPCLQSACQQAKAGSSKAGSSIITCTSPANSGNLENFFKFVALISRTMWLINWKLYYRASCFHNPKSSFEKQATRSFLSDFLLIGQSACIFTKQTQNSTNFCG